MKRNVRKVIAFLLTLCMCFSTVGGNAYAQEGKTEDVASTGWDGVTTESCYEGKNIRVRFFLVSYWDGGYNANVKIENTGTTVIENWCMQFDLNNTILSMWNAVVENKESDTYVVKNAGWNADIIVDGSVEFGFSVNENFSGFPTSYTMIGGSATEYAEAYSVEYILDSDWGDGFTGRILITNKSEETIEDWTLEFDFEREISEIWNGVIESNEGNHYVVKNAGYNANIAAGQTCSFGFCGKGSDSSKKPYEFCLSSYTQMKAVDEELVVNEKIDTDGDLLLDYMELYYGTDINMPDTDGDGLTDYEEIQLNLNPTGLMTDGILDSEYKTRQVMSGNELDINGLEDAYECRIDINGVGLASERLSVIPTMNMNLINSEFILGNIIDIAYVGAYNDASISFMIDEAYIDNYNSEYAKTSDELRGIKRFQIFKLDIEQMGMYPIETNHDVANNAINAEVDELGTFCIIDLEKWLDSLDIAPDKIEETELETELSLFSVGVDFFDTENMENGLEELVCTAAEISDGTIITAPTYYVDIVFLVNNSQKVDIKDTKEKLTSLTEMLYNKNYYNIRVGVTSYCCYLCSKTKGLITYESNNNMWADNATDAVSMIEQMQQDSNPHQTHLDGLGAALNTYDFRENAKKILVHIVNDGTEYTSNRYDLDDMSDVAKKLNKKDIKGILVAGGRYVDDFKKLYSETNGIYSSIVSSYDEDIMRYINYLFETSNEFRIINPISLRYISLDAFPSKGNYLANSDEDGYADYQEIDWSKIEEDGQSLIFPTMREYLKVLNKKYGELFKRLGESYSDRLDSILVLPVKCDPTLTDTDGDGLNDDKDKKPLIYDCAEVLEGSSKVDIEQYKYCMVKFKPEYEEYYDIYSSDEDVVFEIYTKNWLGKFKYISTNADLYEDGNEKFTQYLKRGTTYYIKMYYESEGKSGTIDLNIEEHLDKLVNSKGGSWISVGKRTYAGSFVDKIVYVPEEYVKELYNIVKDDKYKKLKALVVEIGITATVTYLTGKADAAIMSKANLLGLPSKIGLSESAVSIFTSLITMKVAPDILQMELEAIMEASNTLENGVKIVSMTIPYSKNGVYTEQMINKYEAWDGIEMQGVEGQVGRFTIGDYEAMWR